MSGEKRLNFYHSYVYDSPDGQDCARKTFHMTKITGFFGTLLGLYDITLVSRAGDVWALSLGRVVAHAGPAAAVGAIFASTTCISAHMLTGRDTAWNHMLGGCAAGSIYGVRMNKGIIGCAGCVAGGSLAGLTRLAKLHDGPPPIQDTSNNYSFNSYRRRWLSSWGPDDHEPPKDY